MTLFECANIGKNFGSDIGFEDRHMIYFYMGSTAILLWKAGWWILVVLLEHI
jgi:hypothetical protein